MSAFSHPRRVLGIFVFFLASSALHACDLGDIDGGRAEAKRAAIEIVSIQTQFAQIEKRLSKALRQALYFSNEDWAIQRLPSIRRKLKLLKSNVARPLSRRLGPRSMGGYPAAKSELKYAQVESAKAIRQLLNVAYKIEQPMVAFANLRRELSSGDESSFRLSTAADDFDRVDNQLRSAKDTAGAGISAEFALDSVANAIDLADIYPDEADRLNDRIEALRDPGRTGSILVGVSQIYRWGLEDAREARLRALDG